MRRLALLVPVVLAGSLALTGCSGGGPGTAAGKSVQSPQTVVEGMHYVQLFHVVDPVVAQLSTKVDSLPSAAELRTAERRLVAPVRGAGSRRSGPSGSGGQTLEQAGDRVVHVGWPAHHTGGQGHVVPGRHQGLHHRLGRVPIGRGRRPPGYGAVRPGDQKGVAKLTPDRSA